MKQRCDLSGLTIDRSDVTAFEPVAQLPPFDVNTPYPTEIAGVKF